MATDNLSREVSKRTGWSIFMGLVTAAVGLGMIVYPFATAVLSTVFLGWALLVAGVAQFIFAFQSETPGSFFLKILFGVLYFVAGIALAAFPLEGVLTLTVLLGSMLIAEGIIEMIIAFELPKGGGRGWFVFSSLTGLLLGVLILAQWPSSSGWAIGTMVGVAVLISGITRVAVSSTIRHAFGQAERVIHAA
jgi:uncharacterized membrane protein HdeD (DUF308 family)